MPEAVLDLLLTDWEQASEDEKTNMPLGQRIDSAKKHLTSWCDTLKNRRKAQADCDEKVAQADAEVTTAYESLAALMKEATDESRDAAGWHTAESGQEAIQAIRAMAATLASLTEAVTRHWPTAGGPTALPLVPKTVVTAVQEAQEMLPKVSALLLASQQRAGVEPPL